MAREVSFFFSIPTLFSLFGLSFRFFVFVFVRFRLSFRALFRPRFSFSWLSSLFVVSVSVSSSVVLAFRVLASRGCASCVLVSGFWFIFCFLRSHVFVCHDSVCIFAALPSAFPFLPFCFAHLSLAWKLTLSLFISDGQMHVGSHSSDIRPFSPVLNHVRRN